MVMPRWYILFVGIDESLGEGIVMIRNNIDIIDKGAYDLYQMVYISRITSVGLLDPHTLQNIAQISIQKNKANEITGILCYGNGYFFQCVEGSEQALTNLKNSLLMDERHQDMSILTFSPIAKRRFSQWSMRSIVLERWMLGDPNAMRLIPFKPYSWNDNDWQHFLNLLQAYYEDQTQLGVSDTQPVKYNALGMTLTRVVGEHQAFFVVQAFLAVMIIFAISLMMILH